jgi:phage gp29-like protein
MPNSLLARFSARLGARRSPPKGELAQVRGVVGSALAGLLPYNPDDLIGSRGYAIYDQMQRDAQIQACLTIKKLAVLSHGWEVHPASEDPSDREVADFVRFALEDMRGSILDVLYNAMDALAKGFSVMEINYRTIEREPFGGMVGLASIKSKDPSTFVFDLDEYANIRFLRRQDVSGTHSRSREALPPEKFVVYTYMPRYESPYGTSDLRAAYKHYWSKDVLTRFLNMYLEKYGSPTARGTYKRGTPKAAQEELLKVIDKIQQQTAIVIPDDVQIDLMEATRGGEAGYLQAIEFHDKQIAKAILSQTLVVDEGARVGSFALAKVHLDVVRMCLKKLKRDLEETVMQEQVIRRLVDYNYTVTSYPTFTLGPLEDQDAAQLAEVISKLVSGEVIRPDEGWIREYLGLPGRDES